MRHPLRARILAHRGHWKNESGYEELEKNSLSAIMRASELGFGLEVDLRDFHGKIAISHDPVVSSDFNIEQLLCLDFNGPVALNVKSDGLVPLIETAFKLLEPRFEYFFFDMSVPEAIKYLSRDLPIASRISEIETFSSEPQNFVWLDSFKSDWYKTQTDWMSTLDTSKVVIVSPELHERTHVLTWKWIAEQMNQNENLYLCTDNPLEYLRFWESTS
jgi:hypothetical protein